MVRLLFLVVWILGRLAGVVVCVVLATGCAVHQVAGKGRLADGVATVPAEPALIRENSKAGAEATARYWLELLDYSVFTGDTKRFGELTSDGCSGCRDTAKNIENIYSGGSHIFGDPFKILDQSVDVFNPDGTAVVSLYVSTGKAFLVKPDGTQSVYAESENLIYQYELHWNNAHWNIVKVANANK